MSPIISLAFDDGLKNHITTAFPILEKYGLKGTFYVVVNNIDKLGYLHWQDLKILENAGNEIGSHGMTHRDLLFSFPWRIKREVYDSKNILESKGFTVGTFGYPYGRYNNWVFGPLRKAGYKGARAFRPLKPYNDADTNPYKIGTAAVLRSSTFNSIKKYIDTAVTKDTWLVITFHDIQANPTFWGTTPSIFEEICMYIKEKNANIVTIAEGLKFLR